MGGREKKKATERAALEGRSKKLKVKS